VVLLDETMKHLLQTINELDEKNEGNGAHEQDIISIMQSKGLEHNTITEIIENLKFEGAIYSPRLEYLKVLGPLKELFKDFGKQIEDHEDQEDKEHKNFKYVNGEIHFTIQNHFKTLCDVEDVSEHSDGRDRKFKKLVEIKTAKLFTRNYIRSCDRIYHSAGQFVFYRTNHEELIQNEGIYKFIIYDYEDDNIGIHAVKDIPAKDINHLIEASASKEKIGIRWTRFFKNVSDIPIFEISKSNDIVIFQKTQKEWLRTLQDLSLMTIKVSKEARGNPSKWTILNEATFPIDHRTILEDEIVFDIDSPDWAQVKEWGKKLISKLEDREIPFLLAYSGGRGLHVHVFFNLTEEQQEICTDFKVSMKNLRIWLFNHILTGLDGDMPHIIPKELIGKGKLFDNSCVNWNNNRKGHLIRIFGGRKKSYKTLISEIPNERPYVDYNSVKFPTRVRKWEIPTWILQKYVREMNLKRRKEEAEKEVIP